MAADGGVPGTVLGLRAAGWGLDGAGGQSCVASTGEEGFLGITARLPLSLCPTARRSTACSTRPSRCRGPTAPLPAEPALCTASEPPPAAVGHVEPQWYRGAGGGPAGSWEMEHLRPLAPLPIPMTPGQASSTTPSPHEPGCDSLHTGAPDPPPGLSCFRRCSSGPFTCSWPPQGPAGSTTYVLVLW